jgi:hypothetical protein
MKKLITWGVVCALITVSTAAFSQSNDAGVIQIGFGYGITGGGAKITNKPEVGESTKADGVGAKGNYGLRAQYGLSEKLSAGIYVRGEAAVYVVTFDDPIFSGFDVPDVTYTGTAFGLEAKYYFVNEDNINVYAGPSIGYTTGKDEYSDFFTGTTNETKYGGLNYQVGVGLNWYFVSDVFGLSFDLAYQGTSLSGDQDIESYDTNGNPVTYTNEVKVTNGGLYYGLGLTARFGGN